MFIFLELGMRLCSKEACVIVLTEKDVWLRTNGKEAVSLKTNRMALVACNNNIIDFSSLNNTLVIHISCDIIKDYLRFLNKDLLQIPLWQRSVSPMVTVTCLMPNVSRAAAQHSVTDAVNEAERERACSLLFVVLSHFPDSKKLISLLMYTLRNCISNSVYHIVENGMHRDWNLSMVVSCLCLNPSLLEKKLKSENISYSQIITICYTRCAVNQLPMDGKSISRVS